MNDELEWNRARLWKISEITWRWWMLYSLTRSLFFLRLLLFSFLFLWLFFYFPFGCLMLTCQSYVFDFLSYSFLCHSYRKCLTFLWLVVWIHWENQVKADTDEKLPDIKNLLSSLWWNQSGFCSGWCYVRCCDGELHRIDTNTQKNREEEWESEKKKLEENSTDLFHLKSIVSLSQWWCLKLHVVHVVQIFLNEIL